MRARFAAGKPRMASLNQSKSKAHSTFSPASGAANSLRTRKGAGKKRKIIL
jgi:hypothetical protein